ncbi:MAG: hypothetical protein HY741_23345 [Chloroflexi bacterium]|nr:hypothetical protein [Chloroflexota bacterium]
MQNTKNGKHKVSQMVRKQIYISKRQHQLLKRIAHKRQVSEALLIREAIDQQLQSAEQGLSTDAEAWQRAFGLMKSLHAQGPLPNRSREWTRADLYAERINRYGTRAD